MPILVGLTAVFATLGLITLPSQLVPMDTSVNEVILLIGLAVGVDYSLFYLRRERDERRAGEARSGGLEAAAATSGRAVLISGFTVMIAMAGMLLSGDKTFMSFAIGTMMVVAVAMIGSLTVLPAVLSKLGDRVEKGRVPFLHRLRRDNDEGGRFWGAILRPVLRHPVLSTLAIRRRARRARASRLAAATRPTVDSTRCRRASRNSRRSTSSTTRSPVAQAAAVVAIRGGTAPLSAPRSPT